jgi:hypothetical protein
MSLSQTAIAAASAPEVDLLCYESFEDVLRAHAQGRAELALELLGALRLETADSSDDEQSE